MSMQISDLLRSDVFDADNRRIGQVDDVELVQDGPVLEGFGNAFRVQSLVVGNGGFAVRLGYGRHDIRGPWLLRKLASLMERNVQTVPWSRVASCHDRRIILN
jgi:sporulation protein YlmC with PRC-barrel domain